MKQLEEQNSKLSSVNETSGKDFESIKKVVSKQRQKIELLTSEVSEKEAEILKLTKDTSEKLIAKETAALMTKDTYEA